MDINNQWPPLYFRPVNLWTVMSAEMFYASPEEQERIVWRSHIKPTIPVVANTKINDNPKIRQILTLIEGR